MIEFICGIICGLVLADIYRPKKVQVTINTTGDFSVTSEIRNQEE